MDLQAAIVSIYTKGQGDLPTRVASVLKKARDRGLSVIHVRVGFRPGMPEIMESQASQRALDFGKLSIAFRVPAGIRRAHASERQ